MNTNRYYDRSLIKYQDRKLKKQPFISLKESNNPSFPYWYWPEQPKSIYSEKRILSNIFVRKLKIIVSEKTKRLSARWTFEAQSDYELYG